MTVDLGEGPWRGPPPGGGKGEKGRTRPKGSSTCGIIRKDCDSGAWVTHLVKAVSS